MKTWINFADASVFAIPLIDAVGGVRVYEGMLIEGPQGWGEFSAPPGCDDERAGPLADRVHRERAPSAGRIPSGAGCRSR